MENVKGTERTERARNWTFILYPTECKEHWRKILEELCVPACVSPLHTPSDKKPHYHVLVSGDKKTELQIQNEICRALGKDVEENGEKKIGGVTKPQRIVNLRATVRYFLHLDNPSKQQFEKKELSDFGGFDSQKYLVDSDQKKKEKYGSIKDVIKIIKENRFNHIIDLLDFLGDCNEDLFTVVCENAYLCTQLVSKYSQKNTKERLEVSRLLAKNALE